MSITITGTLMTSDQTRHTAAWSQHAAADGQGAWVVSWLPGRRLLTRDQAITAMTLAEVVATQDVATDPWRLHVEGWAAELGLTAQQAVGLLTVVA
jgi:hypothetical protein